MKQYLTRLYLSHDQTSNYHYLFPKKPENSVEEKKKKDA